MNEPGLEPGRGKEPRARPLKSKLAPSGPSLTSGGGIPLARQGERDLGASRKEKGKRGLGQELESPDPGVAPGSLQRLGPLGSFPVS